MDPLKNILYNSLVDNGLIYNTCWEDPRIDRKLLDIQSDSRIVMITSAGCNALDYLLDHPRQIHALDINPAQNALLELKKALFSYGNYNLLKRFFGNGRVSNAEEEYNHKLRERLPAFARNYWDNHIHNFYPAGTKRSFYDTGGAGALSRLVRCYLSRKNLLPRVEEMVRTRTLEEQNYHYEIIKDKFWSPLSRWLLNTKMIMSLAGVARRQMEWIVDREGGIYNYLAPKLDHVFSNIDLRDNYFWYVYLIGSYQIPSNCPNYLRPANFETICKRQEVIKSHNHSVVEFLRNDSSIYSHFVLLDHQDWLETEELREEWTLILEHSKPGTRILFRSVLPGVIHLPKFVQKRVNWHPSRTGAIKSNDRVGTYGSLNLATVK